MQTKKNHAEYMQEWRKKHPEYNEKQKIAFKRFCEKNPNYLYEHNKQWRKIHPKEILEKNHRYRKKHPEMRAKEGATYRKTHPEKILCRKKALKYPLGSKCNKCGSENDLQRHHPDYSESIKKGDK